MKEVREESRREEASPAPCGLQTPRADPGLPRDVRVGWGWFHVGLDLSVDCCTRQDFDYSHENTLVSDEKTSVQSFFKASGSSGISSSGRTEQQSKSLPIREGKVSHVLAVRNLIVFLNILHF